MSKIRVYELARELKIESKLLVNKLKDLGIEVSSHQSTLSADQVLKIKRELSSSGGSSEGSTVSAAPRTSPSVIRRRRGADEAAESTDGGSEDNLAAGHEDEPAPMVAEAPQVAAAPASAPATVRREKAKEPSVAKESTVAAKAETPKTAAPENIKAVQDQEAPKAEIPAKSVQVQEVSVSAEPVAEKPAPTLARENAKTIPSPAPESRSMSRPQENYDSAKIVRREPLAPPTPPPAPTPVAPPRLQPSGAATIIRRASPEEMEQRQQLQQQQAQSRSANPSPIIRVGAGGHPGVPAGGGPIRRDGPPPRREEGGRPPFGSSGGNRSSSSSDPIFRKPVEAEVSTGLTDSPARRWEDITKSKDRDKKKLTAAEAEQEAAAKKNPKIRRDQVNMRSLLDQVASLEAEEADPGIEVAELPVEVEKIKRTVYTPPGMGQIQHGSSRGGSGGRKDLRRRKDLKKTQVTTPRAAYRIVTMGNSITVAELAKQMAVKAAEIIKKLMMQGMMTTLNQAIDVDTATLLATEYGFEVKTNIITLDDILTEKRKAHEGAEFVERPPIVTIMGHVDHGKTSILDAIRKAKVAASEAGGITQHIGAYTVDKDGKRIAFLDTPGHEAFSSMRARGAKATDIVVLVVAADDGVMPQTVEAISHARAAGVPIIVAINKIDKPSKNLDRINSELAEHGIQSEEWGGENIFVKVSALKGIGIDELLEAILLQAEVLELKTPLDVPASGVVVEAHLDKGRGPVATIMIQKGILKVGDFVVAGTSLGRVRAMHDQTGKRLKETGPSTPVEVVGLASVPMAGDQVDAVEDEKTGKEVADWRIDTERLNASTRSSAATLDQLLAKVKNTETPEVPIIIKADTQGSVEAISEAILKLNSDRVRNRIVHKAVGGVNESDVSLATTSGAVIIGFNVRAVRGLDEQAEKQGTLIKYFSVIYDIVDALKSVMAGKLPPIQKEVILGHAEVRATIKVPKIGLVAGTSVLDGKITRQSHLRLIRESVVVFTGRVGSLRRFKDDVREVVQGYECGIGIDGYSDVREGDIIESFIIEEHAAVL
ncbi:MAG: translation initiation factor IF-2 [Proteobacteria bacterium]|nr:MAG: translation initiation factor IF-2 [Pseudomonadota bacterium]